MRLLLLLALLTLTACASPAAPGAEPPAASDPAAGGISQADDDLQVEFDRGDGTEPESWTLTCVGVVEGSHPEAEAACAHLATMADPFAPLPADRVCTEQYGGPQTAHVVGRWKGQPVDLELSRVDGCAIAQWDSLFPLVPAETGAGPVG